MVTYFIRKVELSYYYKPRMLWNYKNIKDQKEKYQSSLTFISYFYLL